MARSQRLCSHVRARELLNEFISMFLPSMSVYALEMQLNSRINTQASWP